MHERRSLKRVTSRLAGHFRHREFAEFFVNEWEQFLRGFGIALLNAIEDARDVVHGMRIGPRARDVEVERNKNSPTLKTGEPLSSARFGSFSGAQAFPFQLNRAG
jgi:hypothetical protein